MQEKACYQLASSIFAAVGETFLDDKRIATFLQWVQSFVQGSPKLHHVQDSLNSVELTSWVHLYKLMLWAKQCLNYVYLKFYMRFPEFPGV